MNEGAADEVVSYPEPPRATPGFLARVRGRDHTRGNLLVSVLVLSLPSILTMTFSFGVFQMLELSFLGRLGEHSLAAAGSSDQVLRQGLMLLVMGMTVASQMMIARFVGAGWSSGRSTSRARPSSLGAALAPDRRARPAALFPETLVRLIARDAEVIALATVYVRIVFLTFFVMISGQIFSTVLNGAGDTTTRC